MNLTAHQAEIRPFIDKFAENPEEYFLLKVLADKLDELGDKKNARQLRGWELEKQPPNRHTNLYKTGVPFFMTHTTRSWHIELWCLLIEADTRCPVDFSWTAGRAVVRREDRRRHNKPVYDSATRLLPVLRHYFLLEYGKDIKGFVVQNQHHIMPGYWMN